MVWLGVLGACDWLMSSFPGCLSLSDPEPPKLLGNPCTRTEAIMFGIKIPVTQSTVIVHLLTNIMTNTLLLVTVNNKNTRTENFLICSLMFYIFLL